jgi:hypothetical protein
MAAADASAAAFVSALPPALALRVFARVPADIRARCAAVCRAWRAALAEPAAWARLDLSLSSGVPWRRLTDRALRAAAAKAAGRLAALDVRGASQRADVRRAVRGARRQRGRAAGAARQRVAAARGGRGVLERRQPAQKKDVRRRDEYPKKTMKRTLLCQRHR